MIPSFEMPLPSSTPLYPRIINHSIILHFVIPNFFFSFLFTLTEFPGLGPVEILEDIPNRFGTFFSSSFFFSFFT
ncbi:hypothetical protein GGS20DRAFT_333602 [Poronia punctata]|nr:hypothetical protein GGS20DRAFT_333602 [Poronia punctata]